MPALFYHLTRSSLEDTVATILSRALEMGWRVVLRCPADGAALAARLDERLWTRDGGAEGTGFLPHGRAGGPQDAAQPVLICEGPRDAGPAQALMAVGGAEVAAAEIAGHERVWILFDGNDPEALARARDQWRDLTGAGAAAQYWSEEGGRWEKKTERGG
ncbi:DNA polymerase III subunit chi [Frigidibacter sp. MR17.24]|uniref:DNA polymerase III subunit chi n=1 Tax=Frigidibacter sp. MR17.24 TaxID=3127345 RepID=UPI003012C176